MTIPASPSVPLEGDLQDAVDIISTAIALGLTVPVIPNMTGWMLTVDRYDDSNSEFYRSHSSFHATEENAYVALANWVTEEWDGYEHDFWKMLEEDDFLPLRLRSDKQIVEKHFRADWNRDLYYLQRTSVSLSLQQKRHFPY